MDLTALLTEDILTVWNKIQCKNDEMRTRLIGLKSSRSSEQQERIFYNVSLCDRSDPTRVTVDDFKGNYLVHRTEVAILLHKISFSLEKLNFITKEDPDDCDFLAPGGRFVFKNKVYNAANSRFWWLMGPRLRALCLLSLKLEKDYIESVQGEKTVELDTPEPPLFLLAYLKTFQKKELLDYLNNNFYRCSIQVNPESKIYYNKKESAPMSLFDSK